MHLLALGMHKVSFIRIADGSVYLRVFMCTDSHQGLVIVLNYE